MLDVLRAVYLSRQRTRKTQKNCIFWLAKSVRAAPLLRVEVKFTIKYAVCEESSATASGDFDCDFDFHSHEWACSELDRAQNIKHIERIDLTQLE